MAFVGDSTTTSVPFLTPGSAAAALFLPAPAALEPVAFRRDRGRAAVFGSAFFRAVVFFAAAGLAAVFVPDAAFLAAAFGRAVFARDGVSSAEGFAAFAVVFLIPAVRRDAGAFPATETSLGRSLFLCAIRAS
ncbi:hypothetical protein GCWU000246_01069 [Jonquetella anthropi E3_33 E1]|nr:hypothetical protein GCWU000246_01069 [Jonquetella anthropi E3_33 E1]